MLPCRLRRIFFENLTTKWCILKYIWIFKKTALFACFRFLVFHQFSRGISWPYLPLCADAHVANGENTAVSRHDAIWNRAGGGRRAGPSWDHSVRRPRPGCRSAPSKMANSVSPTDELGKWRRRGGALARSLANQTSPSSRIALRRMRARTKIP